MRNVMQGKIEKMFLIDLCNLAEWKSEKKFRKKFQKISDKLSAEKSLQKLRTTFKRSAQC